VVLALDAGLRGMTILPAGLARSLASTEGDRTRARTLTSSQQSWLRELASGTTVHDLASEVGFSEREMYRRLRVIYRAMGVRTRTEALILASASGLLERL
jgi:DNA-binding NarL/FixJ family response regulator